MNQVHRHRTLVLNSSSATPGNGEKTENSLGSESQISSNGNAASNSSPAWVMKTDRHMQLINPAIFEKQSQDRAKAIEETRSLKLKQRDEREKTKINKHLQRFGNQRSFNPTKIRNSDPVANYELIVQGVRFLVAKGGSKLIKVSGENPVEIIYEMHAVPSWI